MKWQFMYFTLHVKTLASLRQTALWLMIFSYAPCIYKPLHVLYSRVLSSAHPWVRSVIAVVVTAEPLGSTTDCAPPGRSRHVSRFPEPRSDCVCVFVFALVSLWAFSMRCMENEKRCVGTFCGPESPRMDGEWPVSDASLASYYHPIVPA